MGLSQEFADFSQNVANAPDAPGKAALLLKVRETTLALREYQAGVVKKGRPSLVVTTEAEVAPP